MNVDWEDVASQVGVMRRWMEDVHDLMDAVAVSGLLWPDPDLATDLRSMADRSRGLGAAGGAVRMETLADAVLEIRAAGQSDEVKTRTANAIDALHQVLDWFGRMRAEVDGLAVQADLVTRDRVSTTMAEARGYRGEIWPTGIELQGERALVHALELDTGDPVLVVDRLTEMDDGEPGQGNTISRMFQERVRLPNMMSQVWVFEGHPERRQGRARVLQPDFEGRPRLRSIEPGELLPAPAPAPPVLPDESEPRYVRMLLGRNGDGPLMESGEARHVVDRTSLLYWTLTKLGLSHGVVNWFSVVRMRKGELVLLAVHPPDAPSCHPHVHGGAFSLDIQSLVSTTSEAVDPDSLWLRAMCARLSGRVDSDLVAALEGHISPDPEGRLRVARATAVLGHTPPESLGRDLVERAAQSGASGTVLVGAIWMALLLDRVEAWQDPLRVAWDAHLAQAPSSPDPQLVAARAVFMAVLQVGPEDATRSPVEAARAYLDAHVGQVRVAAFGDAGTLPPLDGLTWLAEAYGLMGEARSGPALAALGLPTVALRAAIADGLWGLARDAPEQAADALWAVELLGWRSML